MVTSGDGVIYNVTRTRMLNNSFRWTDPDKYAAVVSAEYTFNEWHKTLAEVIFSTVLGGVSHMPSPFISGNAWAGSSPVAFSGEVWGEPVGSLVISRYFGSATQYADYSKYELIACLTTFLGGPIYPDGSPFNITFDQSSSQQGWFRP